MKRKLYARELLNELVKDEELRILEVVWDESDNDEKIQQLLSE